MAARISHPTSSSTISASTRRGSVRRTVPSGENSWRRLCPAKDAPPDDDDDDIQQAHRVVWVPPAFPARSQSSQCISDLNVVFLLVLSNSQHSLQPWTQAPLFLSVMACDSLEKTQVNPLYLSKNLISQHAR